LMFAQKLLISGLLYSLQPQLVEVGALTITEVQVSSCRTQDRFYFDSTLLSCKQCPDNSKPASDYLSCQCSEGAIEIAETE